MKPCIYTLQLRGSEFSSTITSLGGTSLASEAAIGGRGKEAVGFFSDGERERGAALSVKNSLKKKE